MVLYLGLNYLEQAVAAKRSLLGKCLIVVPQHLDHVDAYLHQGNIPNEKYRSPWKRVKTDDQVLIQESTNIFADVQALVAEDMRNNFSVEPFHSQSRQDDTSLIEYVNFDLHCDVIPSSNPSTQDPFTPDDLFSEHSIFQELFEKEDLTTFSSTCATTHNMYLYAEFGEHFMDKLLLKLQVDQYFLKIEAAEKSEEGLHEILLSIPDISRLASRLKSVHVKDPLLQENGQPLSEDCLFRNERIHSPKTETSILKTPYILPLVKETFEKMAVQSSLKEELEECETLHRNLLEADEVSMMKSVMLKYVTIPRTVIVMEDEPAVKVIVSKDIVKQDQTQLQTIEKLDLSLAEVVKSSFLEINEIIVTEQDKFCEQALLDTPVVEDFLSYKNYTKQVLPVLVREVFEMPLSHASLLDDEKQQSLTQRMWQLHKYCDEIQASRLPEPEFAKVKKARELAVKQALKKLNVQTDKSTGRSDLELNWNIITYTEELPDPCKLVAPFTADIIALEGHEKEVEKVEKYRRVDLYGWEDKEIILDDKEKSTENICQTINAQQKTLKVMELQNKESLGSSKKLSDPLIDFITLRAKSSAVQSWNAQADEKVCDSAPLKKDPLLEEKKGLKQNVEAKKRLKHHVVEIQLTETHQCVLDLLEATSENCMHVLKQKEEISSSSTFKTITPDISRFLLKQREKYLMDHREDGVSDEVYKMLLLLHGLVVASEITENCCMESALGYLSALQEKYKDHLGGCLDAVRQKLFKLKAKMNVDNEQHPKVMTLCKEVETWLKKKRAKTKESEQKILILVKREMPSLMNCLKDALGIGSLFSPCIPSSQEPESIIQSLDKHNCVIVCTKSIMDNFPWAQFSLVVEYENDKFSQWQQLCERQNIRHIGLSMKSVDKTVDTFDKSEWISEYPEQQLSVIASEKVTKNTDLLQLLETRHNILLIERDYSLIGNTKHLFFSDLDVDVNSAIVIEDMKTMIDDCVVQNAVTKVVALSLKYTRCWLILFSYQKSGSYQLPGHVISNISRLQAAVSNFMQRSRGFHAKVLFCEGCNELSSLIRNVCEDCITFSKNGTTKSCLDRSWLSNEVSEEERFLLILPCLNSMSAQLLMKQVSMFEMCGMSVEDLSEAVPEISVRTLKTLKSLICSSTGLNLRQYQEMKANHEYDEDQDHEEITCRNQDGEDIHQTESKKSLTERCYKGREAVRNMYVPEDFQTCIKGLNTNFKDCNNSHEMKKSFNTTLKLTDGNLRTKHNLAGDENSKQDNSEMQEVDDTTNYIGNWNQRMVCVEKSKNHDNTIYKNNENGWELLDNFISGNKIVDESGKCLDDDNANTRINPSENPSCIKRNNILERNTLHRNSSLNYSTIRNNKTTQFSDEQFKGNNIMNLKQSESVSSFNTPQSFSEKPGNLSIDLVEPLKKQGFNGSEKVHEAKEEGNLLHAYQKVSSQNTTSRPYLETSGLQMKTFEYNHGLPLLTSRVYSQMQELPSRKEILNTSEMFLHSGNVGQFDKMTLGHAAGCRTPKKRIDVEKEFPPADEIDRSVSFESQARDNQLICFGHENGPARVCETSQHNKMFITDITSDVIESVSQTGGRESFSNKPNETYSFVSSPLGTIEELDKKTGLYNNEAYNKEFNFNPKFIESHSTDELYSLQQNGAQDLYLNPKLERISQKIYVVDNTAERNPAIPVQSLEDDLRETTKKLLANNRQFSRFDLHTKRHPLQKVSIGLAQPWLRKSTRECKEELNMPEEGWRRMAQSPWAAEDSPPMDLEYENTEFSCLLQTSGTANRASYTNQTPQKKRKLTYQCIPGRKGQTQLVFK